MTLLIGIAQKFYVPCPKWGTCSLKKRPSPQLKLKRVPLYESSTTSSSALLVICSVELVNQLIHCAAVV